MALIKWSLKSPFKIIFSWIKWRCQRWKFYIQSFMYNHFLDQSYTADVCMEPMFWFVDNFTSVLGPFFVVAVICLTVSVVTIAYWIGLPYWWKKDPSFTVILLIVGHWLLINNVFHYYMAVTTPPGYPPEDELITEAVSVCKKCISPKPPRTHHCSVCNRCILKMDHHCPWLNNCVGFFNHRYFYMYMVYTVIGVLFIILCGYDLAISAIFYESELDIESSTEPELIGHPVRINASGVMIKMPELLLNVSTDHHLNDEKFYVVQNDDNTVKYSLWERRAIMYMALLNTGVLVALGSLSSWHGRLISHGETSIEANINKAETKRLAALGKIYINPYDFGTRKNWRLFLGLVKGRSWFWNVVLPSAHKAEGSGLIWHTVHDDKEDEWP